MPTKCKYPPPPRGEGFTRGNKFLFRFGNEEMVAEKEPYRYKPYPYTFPEYTRITPLSDYLSLYLILYIYPHRARRWTSLTVRMTNRSWSTTRRTRAHLIRMRNMRGAGVSTNGAPWGRQPSTCSVYTIPRCTQTSPASCWNSTPKWPPIYTRGTSITVSRACCPRQGMVVTSAMEWRQPWRQQWRKNRG